MKTIYKYDIVSGVTHLHLPVGSIFLSIQVQNETPRAWFIVDTDETNFETRVFIMCGTGHPLDEGTYLGTFQTPPFVFHLFERPKNG